MLRSVAMVLLSTLMPCAAAELAPSAELPPSEVDYEMKLPFTEREGLQDLIVDPWMGIVTDSPKGKRKAMFLAE